MGAQEAGPFGQRIIVGNQKTAVAEASEILGREEAVSAEVPDGADWFAFVFGSDSLGTVLDDKKIVGVSQGHDGVHVSTLAEKMHRNDGLGF